MTLLSSALLRRTAGIVARRPVTLSQRAISTPRARLAASHPVASTSSSLHTTAALAITSKTWGGGKLKTHKGTAKRFRGIGKRLVVDKRSWSERSGYQIRSPSQIKFAEDQVTVTHIEPRMRQVGVFFKSKQAGIQHGMSSMSSGQRGRKGQAGVHRRKSVVQLLSRLIGNRKRK